MLFLRTYVTEGVKQAVKNEYDQRLEVHKAQLASQTAVEIEKLKSQLASAAAEKQLRFHRRPRRDNGNLGRS